MTDVVTLEGAEHYLWGGDCDGWHLLKSPGLSVIQERVPPARGEVPHYHEHAQQFFYVLAGEATLELEGRIVRVLPNQGCAVPPRVRHVLRNDGTEDLVFIVMSAPPSHGDRVIVD